ncbi:transcription factor Tfb4 [Multifurca ochricompacta]|uniref:General transcription and DNA repair factor IIH subunit TFB4 n=1 Tax=Multifurca ochricompacta TaxID=376703 RepID=A0AAD4M941_9AGAM|nr:transcription factor Tfb4 [Multifurca ochricompacta]
MNPSSHLSLIIDLSPSQWHLSAQSNNSYPLSFQTFLSHVLTFVNSHLAFKHENTLAVFGALPGRSMMLYSSLDATSANSNDPPADANSYRPFKLVNSVVANNIQKELDAIERLTEEPPVALVGALTKALCCKYQPFGPSTTRKRGNEATTSVDPRILILSVSPDLSASYIPVMNSIFSAQKLKVTIDVCKVFGEETVFLQQAAHLTGGSYIYLGRRDAFLQYLTMSFLPPPSMRHIIAVPQQDKVDFRAACFCHKNIVDIGFVCSVCLSIFCSPVPVCSTCRTKFPMKTLQHLNASRPSIPPANGVSNGAPRPPSARPNPGMSASLR